MVSFSAGGANPEADAVRRVAVPFEDGAKDLDPLLDLVGDARFVLVGEASHGTHEFYKIRADLTKRLIREKHFNAVAVEADWPDAWRVNRYVRGFRDDDGANSALAGFERFPQWMWRNADVLDFVGWLREYNDGREAAGGTKAGFYGIDLYSLHGSIRAVLDFLAKVDPEAARAARHRYGCFEHFGEDPQAYGLAAGFRTDKSCEDAVVQQLVDLQRKAADYARRDGRVAEDEYFYAEQNARVIAKAEEYYRQMYQGDANTWNLRDTHMADTLDALADYLDARVGRTKVVVWAHNSHLGDARATDAALQGELNLGQLVRERHGSEAVNVGFSTYTGTVSAADDWDGPAERMRVRPGMVGSYEALLHDVGLPRFLLNLRHVAASGDREAIAALAGPRLQRAIGVIYRPRTERVSHYFDARLLEQFDAMIHVDETRAVEPLERFARAAGEEAPETYPSGV